MTKIFLDTIAFKAFINRNHPKHLIVTETFEDFARLRTHLYTSTLVLSEVHEYLLNSISSSVAQDFISALSHAAITNLRPSPQDEKQALELLLNPQSFNLTLKDALHITLLRRLHIDTTLSSSPHFPRYHIRLLAV